MSSLSDLQTVPGEARTLGGEAQMKGLIIHVGPEATSIGMGLLYRTVCQTQASSVVPAHTQQ